MTKNVLAVEGVDRIGTKPELMKMIESGIVKIDDSKLWRLE